MANLPNRGFSRIYVADRMNKKASSVTRTCTARYSRLARCGKSDVDTCINCNTLYGASPMQVCCWRLLVSGNSPEHRTVAHEESKVSSDRQQDCRSLSGRRTNGGWDWQRPLPFACRFVLPWQSRHRSSRPSAFLPVDSETKINSSEGSRKTAKVFELRCFIPRTQGNSVMSFANVTRTCQIRVSPTMSSLPSGGSPFRRLPF